MKKFLVQHNLPLATADYLGPLFKSIFPDSQIAQSYGCARQKTSDIINVAFQPYCHNYLVEFCKNNPYSVSHDGSNDTGVRKMDPVCIRTFDIKRSKTVSSHFFNMCLTEGEDAAKASTTFAAIEERFVVDDILHIVVFLSVWTTIMPWLALETLFHQDFLEKNNEICIVACPCHLAHIAAGHGNDGFSNYINLNIGDVCVDAFYWFDKSTKCKGKLVEYFEFWYQEYQSVLKHLSARWLSLECCLVRILKKFPSLRSYFVSEDFRDERFRRLNDWFSNPLLEPALLFNQCAISIFTNFNLLLQREEPTIHLFRLFMEAHGRKLAAWIMHKYGVSSARKNLHKIIISNACYAFWIGRV